MESSEFSCLTNFLSARSGLLYGDAENRNGYPVVENKPATLVDPATGETALNLKSEEAIPQDRVHNDPAPAFTPMKSDDVHQPESEAPKPLSEDKEDLKKKCSDIVKVETTDVVMCRFCAKMTSSCVNIFEHQETGASILEKIAKCFRIYISVDDQLPKILCPSCLEKLESCYEFTQQILNAHKTMIQQLGICDTTDPNFDLVLGSYFQDFDILADRFNTIKSEALSYEETDAEYDVQESKSHLTTSKRGGTKRKTKRKDAGERSNKKPGSGRTKLKLKSRFIPSLTTCASCGHKSDSSRENFEHWAEMHKDLIVEYKCFENNCDFKTNCIMTIKQHTKEHMFKEGKLTQCEICAKYFAKRQIKAHLAIHSDNYQYSCNKCGKMFKVRSALVTHEKMHDPEYTQNTYSCEECGKEYSMKHQFDAHVRRHKEIRPYRCEICTKAFWSPNDLQYHMSIHTGLKPYPCSKCDLKFARPLDVKKHFITRHTEPNRFACSKCPVKYNRRDQLRVHELSHTGETPFKCEICGKGFTRKDKLVRHSDVHITDDSKYRYSCHLCEKRYTQSGSLFTHMKNAHGV